MPKAIDTNVLVRVLVDDESTNARSAAVVWLSRTLFVPVTVHD